MRLYLTISIILLLLIFSCKNEKLEQETIPANNNSIDLYNSFGFLADSSFSIKKYQSDVHKWFQEISENNPNVSLNKSAFDDHQFIIHDNKTIYYYFNEFPYDQMCGTGAANDFHNKKITELFEVKKEDLKRIDSDTLIQFVKNLDIRKKLSPQINSSIIIGLNQEQIKNKDFDKLLIFLSEKNYDFIVRPTSTRERLVSDAVFEHKNLNIENLDWDSIHKVDFKNFNYMN